METQVSVHTITKEEHTVSERAKITSRLRTKEEGRSETALGGSRLAFARRFTRDGVHPYDEIAW